MKTPSTRKSNTRTAKATAAPVVEEPKVEEGIATVNSATSDTATVDSPVERKQITAPARLEKLKQQFAEGKLPAGIAVSNSLGRFTAFEILKKG